MEEIAPQLDEKLIIDRRLCDYCGACVAVCPVDCIELKEKEIEIDFEECTVCMNCVYTCPQHIIKENELES